MTKIYTRTGDAGETGLFSGERVPKDHLRLEVYGTLDEVNVLIGMARAKNGHLFLEQFCSRLQTLLFILCSDLATTEGGAVDRIDGRHVRYVESCIDQLTTELPPLRSFVLPSGCEAALHLHLARTVCRRAERRLAALARVEPVNPQAVVLVNRMSDYLFVLARYANHKAGRTDEPLNRDFPELKAFGA